MLPSLRNSAFALASVLLQGVLTVVAPVTALSAAEAVPATPIISTDATVQKHLAELDRLLDASGAKLEEALRKNIERIETENLDKNPPELEVAFKEQPWIVPTLKAERHFLLHRYIARRARGPLLRPDVVALDKFLSEHADIRRALNKEPALIVDGKFLLANPGLAEFFGQHPSLSTVLLDPQDRRSGPKGK
jgi:PAS domain-containing protein